jgi:hypothetical protein
MFTKSVKDGVGAGYIPLLPAPAAIHAGAVGHIRWQNRDSCREGKAYAGNVRLADERTVASLRRAR